MRLSKGVVGNVIPANRLRRNAFYVIPAKAGIQNSLKLLDSCLRRNDKKVKIPIVTQSVRGNDSYGINVKKR